MVVLLYHLPFFNYTPWFKETASRSKPFFSIYFILIFCSSLPSTSPSPWYFLHPFPSLHFTSIFQRRHYELRLHPTQNIKFLEKKINTFKFVSFLFINGINIWVSTELHRSSGRKRNKFMG